MQSALLDRAKNNLRVLLHTRLDRTQRRLLSDAKEVLSELEMELLKPTESETLTTARSEMRRSGRGSGGGIGSNKVTHRSAPKAEPRPRAINPSSVAQLGALVGDHVTNKASTGYRGEELVRGKGYSGPVGPTDNVKAVGVGGGRTTYHCGTQDQHGAPASGNPPAKNTDILSQFGPDYKGRS